MTKRRLKRSVVYGLYGLAFTFVMGTIYVLEVSTNRGFEDDTSYVGDIIINEDNNVPVVNVEEAIIRPYSEDGIAIVKNFYDYKAEDKTQQESLIYYGNTYLQNSGVDYSKQGEEFEVVSILDGKVTNVTENTLLGKTVEITHDNGLVSVYQSLGEVSVTLDSEISQGQAIGKTGTANIATDLGNHLHFELIHNGENVNPEMYYDKKLSEI